MSFLVNLCLGLLFGVGLVVSGMSDPAKVLNFLDLFGTWDPSLAFVMGGAVVVAFLGYRLVLRRARPIAAEWFDLPQLRESTRLSSLAPRSSASVGVWAASVPARPSPHSDLARPTCQRSSRGEPPMCRPRQVRVR